MKNHILQLFVFFAATTSVFAQTKTELSSNLIKYLPKEVLVSEELDSFQFIKRKPIQFTCYKNTAAVFGDDDFIYKKNALLLSIHKKEETSYPLEFLLINKIKVYNPISLMFLKIIKNKCNIHLLSFDVLNNNNINNYLDDNSNIELSIPLESEDAKLFGCDQLPKCN